MVEYMSYTYIDIIKQKNKDMASKCHVCKKQSTGINAYGYKIKYVCNDHRIDDIWATQSSFE